MSEPVPLARLSPLKWPGYFYDRVTLQVFSAKGKTLKPLTLQKYYWKRDYQDGRLKKEERPHYCISVNGQRHRVDIIWLQRLRYKETET